MKTFIHDIVTEIKYLYSCIAYEESHTEEELVITTETRLSSIYPVVKTVKGMKYLGEDYWGRATFINEHEQYYCEVDGELYFKGNDMEGEPHYTVKEIINYEFPDIDNELVEFKPLIKKAKEYFEKKENLELIEEEPRVNFNSDSILDSKIFCTYKIKIIK